MFVCSVGRIRPPPETLFCCSTLQVRQPPMTWMAPGISPYSTAPRMRSHRSLKASNSGM